LCKSPVDDTVRRVLMTGAAAGPVRLLAELDRARRENVTCR
jgi:hypothetical protein